jgi:hypothetical protein
LLRNYSTNRLQIVFINGEYSSFFPVSVEVPQGSVLGPLLFLIYINDIGSLPLRGSVRLFADDTAIFYPWVEVMELVKSVQADLTRLKRYFSADKLTLNADKTSYLVFRALSKKLLDMPPLFYGTSSIKRVNETKYLGLYKDEQLNFKRHIEKLRGKITPMFGMLYKLKFYFSSRILKLIYHAFIYSNV